MRNFIISVVLCALPTMTFAECDDPLLKKIASSVHPKQEVYHGAYNTDPMSCKKIPNNPEQTIFAEILEKEKVENEDNDSGAYDLSLVIAKNNGEIIGRYHKNDFYNTGNGGTVLDDIKVDTANYRLNADTRAFGIVSNFSGRDGREEEITLYVLKQNKIVPVLSNLTLVSSPTVGFDLSNSSKVF